MSTPKQSKGRWVAIFSAGILLAASAVMTSGCGGAAAPAPAPVKKDQKAKVVPASTNNVVVETKSEFDTDLKTKDPFFPKSRRRFGKTAIGKPVAQPKVAELKLRGVIGSPGKYIAMINDKTFAEGDKTQVALGSNQYLVVKVIKITAKSATVNVDGEAAPRELSLEVDKEARK